MTPLKRETNQRTYLRRAARLACMHRKLAPHWHSVPNNGSQAWPLFYECAECHSLFSREEGLARILNLYEQSMVRLL